MPSRSEDWFNQALKDFDAAESTRELGHHEWSCFASHQAAEKAVKALHLDFAQEAWGHVIAKLLSELPEAITVPGDLIDVARVLDNFYIPTRYPNSHASGAPFEHYGPYQSRDALQYARAIIDFVAANRSE